MLEKLIERLSPDKATPVSREVVNTPLSQIPSTTQFAPNTKIAYKPKLVPLLEQQHRDLMAVYWKTLTAAQNHKNELTRQYLIEFKDLLVGHLLQENTSLYIYLRNSARKPSQKEAVTAIKTEMDKLARGIKQFLDKSIKKTDYDADFVERLKLVGDALLERIEKEEAYVYPNYVAN
ncbi:hemerythrin domain-containing protein [Arenicella xantha]|uniref:Hemerythrin HHE cation binding domain-containing protein n=1 Tax=Arenicella xantha TaxID=644221 RepID=A0A395JTF5_9GAMM|nr:hemerythrin domain-containing protein [Arenicella xantha]RBP52858.1 hemerythrin HHE cation binding domain-containing protein [Arenicella xantha]